MKNSKETNPTRLTTEALVDMRGGLCASAADIQEQIKALDVVLRSRIPAGEARDGETFRAVHVVTAEGSTLDKAAVTEEMGTAWAEAHSKPVAAKNFIKSNARMRAVA